MNEYTNERIHELTNIRIGVWGFFWIWGFGFGIFLTTILYPYIVGAYGHTPLQETKEKILFASLRGGDVNRDGKINQKDSELYVVDLDGNNLKRITYNPFQEILVSISPDGKGIAFVGPPLDTVYLMNIDGTRQRELLTTKQSMASKDHYINIHILCKSIPWSRDGSRIFIPLSYPVPSWYLIKKDSDTIRIGPAEWSNQRKRYDVNISNGYGKKIEGVDSPFILVSPRDDNIISILGTNKEIYLISLKDGRKRKLGMDPFLYEAAGSWSPDGKKVCLYRFNKVKNEDDLYLLDLAEKGIPKLKILQQGVMRNQISWSPDGDRIAFISTRDKRLYILGLKDKRAVKIAQEVEEWSHPEWLKNGEGIIFLSRGDKAKHQIYYINMLEGKLKEVIDDSGGILWAKPF